MFRTTYAKLCQAAARVLAGDRALAEQVVMDAFVIVFDRREQIRPETANAYLWKVAMNEARTAATRAAREGQLIDLAARRGHLPHQDVRSDTNPEQATDFAHVRALVDALPVDQRIVVVLHYYYDWPDAEIAAVLDRPAVTVRSQLRRARKSLERHLCRTEAGAP